MAVAAGWRWPARFAAGETAHRALDGVVREVILATNFTAEGETTAHACPSCPGGHGSDADAHGARPGGGELEHTDPGTLAQALFERRGVTGG